MRKRNGDTAWAVRLDTPYEDVVWACGGARSLLRTRWRFLSEEVDRRLLAGEPVDLTYEVVSTDTTAPQAELHLGPSWDGWEPSISC
jgi:Uma2 family endonuclease